MEIADREGFDAVSMRRVAAELDAGTMSLYHYIRTKDDLIALMDDTLMAESLVPAGELPGGWREALTLISRRTREVLVRHPWALTALQESQLGPNAMRHFEQSLAAIAEADLDPAQRFELLGLVDDYVFGNTLHTAESLKRGAIAVTDPEMVRAAMEFGLAQLRTGEFPYTAALVAGRNPDEIASASSDAIPLDSQRLDEQFERGLQTVLDAVAIRFGLPETGAAHLAGGGRPRM
jgi:AcrR family transcriptional regulator